MITQYVRGHLFVFLDSIMGITYPRSNDLETEEWMAKEQHPFEHSEIQKLFRAYLRFVTVYFRKLQTLGKSIQELMQVPRLFLVDPSAAIVSLYPELSETLMRILATEGRTIKHYITKDEN